MKFELPQKKEEILKRVGDMSQIAGVKRYFLADGRGAGVECVDVRNGTGFEYTVMPGRGMDIGWCGYEGMPLSYMSKAGISAPAYFTGVRDQWLQCFPGGMLSTCGLGNVGDFCEDATKGLGMQSFGLHGRISSQCAKNISVSEEWKEDDFLMQVSGTVTEAQLRGERFSLQRTVTSRLGQKCFHVRDVITNEDFIQRPYMIMYHINFGYPLVDQGAKIYVRSGSRFEDTRASAEYADQAYEITEPVNGTEEHLYFHKSEEGDKAGLAFILNEKLDAVAYVKYTADTLPYLTEWKMMGEADYVVGLEAGNCIPRGRSYHRQKGMLRTLEAQQSITNELEIGIITGKTEICAFFKGENIQMV